MMSGCPSPSTGATGFGSSARVMTSSSLPNRATRAAFFSASAISRAPMVVSSAAEERRGWKQAKGWLGRSPSLSGGFSVRHSVVANAHRGANRQAAGGFRRSGGRPGIE